MYQDIYQYLQWVQQYTQALERRIASLEQALQIMRAEIKQLDEKKSIHVDRIEYKFDQLKVETLEGTLTIGLNPNDLSGIEDFSVQNQALNTPMPPKAQMERSMKIEEAIYQYLESDLPQIIEETQKRLGIPPNESYLSFIKEDIVKQLPNRIDEHLKAAASDRSADSSTVDEQIIALLKQEIQNGVLTFLSNLPENLKGMKF
ncbi:spore gernimation protein [Bacillus sp. BRMEA1]|uniref:spore germination protein GerPC n=1 Tax=Neobacillus endophyticus TaxID=2738405 RepID=UPI0015666099|nr:spore germination protein GerPC [Neobacillus endophyticus]NRD78388.1 spore gernimation protein [Neobacillus endophyticus]